MKVLEFIIRAKDATSRGIESAKQRLRSLNDKSATGGVGEIEIKPKVDTSEAESRFSRFLSWMKQKGDEGFGKIFERFGGDWKSFSSGADRAIGQVISRFAGMGSAGSKAFTAIGTSVSFVASLAIMAFKAWYAAGKKYADYLADKWRTTAQIIAENISQSAEGMLKAYARVYREIDRGMDALKRKQSHESAYQTDTRAAEAASRNLDNEQEISQAIANGASSAEINAMRERQRREEEIIKLKGQEEDIDRKIADAEALIRQRGKDRETIEKNILGDVAKKNREGMEALRKVAERINSGDKWWSSKERRNRILEEVEGMNGALKQKAQAAMKAVEEVAERYYKLDVDNEEDRRLIERLEERKREKQLQIEVAEAAHENADAVESVAEAEREAERAARERAAEQEKAAREAERVAEQDARAKKELAALDIDVQRAAHAAQRDPESQVLKAKSEEMRDYYDALLNAQDEAQRDEIRAAHHLQQLKLNFLHELETEDRRAEAERARLEAANREAQHRANVAAAQDELRASQQEQSAASSRLEAAKRQVSQAWGWYRDKDSMQARIDDFKAQQEAEKQWEKDFKSLQSRHRDWRSIDFGKLSADEEAVRQVALAKEEQQAAQKALDAIEQNTRGLAQKLDELLTMKE